ncbi:MAG: AraC family transcriptional regulator [Saprospiraceae bacterium]|nr:AraC family transcriptional regulator [Saprospiraceae bacterium]
MTRQKRIFVLLKLLWPALAQAQNTLPAPAQSPVGFNVWTLALAGVAGLGYLLAGLLLWKRSGFTTGARRLAALMLVFACILSIYLLYWTGYERFFPYFQHWWPCLTFTAGPLVYLYLKEVFQEEFSFKEAAVHFITPVLSGLLTMPVYLRVFGWEIPGAGDLYRIAGAPVLLTGHLLLYTMLVWRKTNNEWQVDTNIKTWTRLLARGMVLYTGAFISYFVLVSCSFFNPEWDYGISLVMSVGILTVAYMGLLQRRVFSSEPIGHFLPVRKYQNSALTPAATASIKRQLERLLEEEQVYRENELRLTDLAAYLNIGHHALSQVINEQYGMNFFELINRYRVAHVRKLLTDPAYGQHTILQIAFEAGFNNKVSFNRCFKKEFGLTPSAYRIREGIER